ncbi:MAG: YhcH/YjgK/YiaL family protein [Nitrospirae bacterium]|nr:YhcH/YjgK/YiaL family protein [Nitrospirota bacterium]
MVVSDLDHIDHQIVRTPGLQKAFAFLRADTIHGLPDGRFEIDGDRVFALVQRYETMITDAPKFECHRKYIDVQFIVSGEEVIGWAPLSRMMITEAYDADKDICFGTAAAGKWTRAYLQTGQLAVLWPEDGHAPKLAGSASSPVMKIVVKVAV